MKTCLYNVRIYPDDRKYIEGSLLIEDGKVVSVEPYKQEADEYTDGHGAIVMPGLIDVHLHGSYGYDFIKDPQQSINTVSEGLIKEGTTSFMASLTVVSHEETCELLKGYAKAKAPDNGSNFLGVHLEGPYLSVQYKALMDERYLRDPDLDEMKEMLECADGVLRIMTIAPERKGMDKLIPYLKDNNVTAMIGHSAATCAQAGQALDLGATGFTHLYNAMSQHTHRDPGNVTCAFLRDDSLCELIVDGHHIDPDVIRATYKSIGSDRIVLITDAMLGKGMDDGDYVFSGLNCRKVGNTVHVIETGRIAGSAITMMDAIRNMKSFCNISFNELVRMACINPSVIAKVQDHKGTLENGKDADFIIVDDNLELIQTWIGGKCVFER